MDRLKKTSSLLTAMAGLILAAGSAQADIVLFQDTFTVGTDTGINNNIAARQAGGENSDTYTVWRGSSNIAGDLLNVGGDAGLFNHYDYLADLTTDPVDFTLSFTAASTGGTGTWISPFLSTDGNTSDDRGTADIGLLIRPGRGTLAVYGGPNVNAATLDTLLGTTWDGSATHTYELVATATTATTGTYDVLVDGILVSTATYAFDGGGSNGEVNFEVRTIGGAAGTFDDLQLTIVPEPGSLALLTLGGLCVLRRRRD